MNPISCCFCRAIEREIRLKYNRITQYLRDGWLMCASQGKSSIAYPAETIG